MQACLEFAPRVPISQGSMRIPRTCRHRGQLTYAKLLVRVYPHRAMANAFEGKLLKPGALIDEAELRPTLEYPAIPLLLEYAGNDRTGRGHRRSHDIYLLWRYDRAYGGWEELVRCASQGADWIQHLKPVALAELNRGVEPRTPPPLCPTAPSSARCRISQPRRCGSPTRRAS